MHKFADGIIGKVAETLSLLRGKEEAELQAFIDTFSNLTGLPKYGIHTMQLFYEFTSLMVPIYNSSGVTSFSEIFGEKWARKLGVQNIQLGKLSKDEREQALGFLERKFCTGIIALNEDDGMVYHARNLDLPLFTNPAQYIANFTRGGREVFLATQIAGYAGVFTGFKRGVFAVQLNTRFTDHVGGNIELFENLLVKRMPLCAWQVRKQLETATDFDQIVDYFSTVQQSGQAYIFLSGVKQGVILARNPSSLEHKLTLGVDDPRYIITTNFDYWNHDIREYFDWTAGDIGTPRRIVAERILNASEVITPEVLWQTINAKGVFAYIIDYTIMQGVMNVETGYFNVSSPVDL